MGAHTLELLAALDSATAFVAQAMAGRAGLLDALASEMRPSPEQIARLQE